MKRRKFILSVVAMLTAMLFSAVNSSVYAKKSKNEPAEIVNSGICGDSVYWKFSPDSGLLVISGKGAINNYNFLIFKEIWTSIPSINNIYINKYVLTNKTILVKLTMVDLYIRSRYNINSICSLK